MTRKIWDGSTSSVDDGSHWSPAGVLAAGDTAVITSGAAIEISALAPGITAQLSPTTSTSAVFNLISGAIAQGAHLAVDGSVDAGIVLVNGTSVNAGGITLNGSGAELQLGSNPGGTATTFVNQGGITFAGSMASYQDTSGNASSALVNNGMIAVQAGTFGLLGATVLGTGTVRVAAGSQLTVSTAMGSGQTIVLEPGSGGSTVQLATGSLFQGQIAGLGASDRILMYTGQWDGSSYSLTGGVGTYTFTLAGATVAQVRFVGGYTQSQLNVSTQYFPSSGIEQTTITTTAADPVARISFTDSTADIVGTESGTAYSGPVAGLQYQYLWDSPDGVAMAATAPDMFLHGGAGNDAIAAYGGSNVLDGGAGSNFLIGATGSDGGADTFFVDGRGGAATWSTLVNFHPGDSATIFGFTAGTSTLPWTASDGTAGYTGATIHSELSGTGTGVNGSITFAGVDLATVNSRFSTSTGTVGGTDYLYIHYNT